MLHNLKNYDGHLIVSALKHYKGPTLSIIPTNTEKYLSIICDSFYFLDSLQFLNASLSVLFESLLKPSVGGMSLDMSIDEKIDIMHQGLHDPEKVKLLKRKGIFPFDYVDTPDKLMETEFPAKELFYNKLTEKHITEEDYNYALSVYRSFSCNNLGEYLDVYLQADVLILACVFENFRSFSLKYYRLDPCHYFSVPGLSLDAMFRMTGVELELLTDIDMINFFQSSIRGGVSLIAKRHATANNKYLRDFDASKPSSYLAYLDANNLYGAAQCDLLPQKSFRWLDAQEIQSFDLMSIACDATKGYVLEIDLNYPEELHESHNSFPLAPEKYSVQYEQLSDFQKCLIDEELFCKGEKLIAHLGPRRKYICHYRNLQFYLKHGLKLEKIHRVLEFEQAAYVREYIEFNTKMRAQCSSVWMSNSFKLFNNSLYGKFIEGVRERMNVKITNERKKALKLAADPHCKSWNILDENLVMFHMQKKKVLLDKPVYAGFTILELSKLYMVEFHYDKMVPLYGSNQEILCSDTDSFLYHIYTEDIYCDMLQNIDWYDTSDYPKDHNLYSDKNKKVLLKMKDECNGKPIKEFVGCSSKCYSMIGEAIEKRVCKGTPSMLIKEQLLHKMYLDSIFDAKKFYFDYNQIRSYRHKIFSVKTRKLCLSPTDTKRYIRADGIRTFSFGHYKLK